MTDHPRCDDCGRSASDWIDIDGTQWEPDLQEVKPNQWLCWACREELHPDMNQKKYSTGQICRKSER